jgi:hypothetical protein
MFENLTRQLRENDRLRWGVLLAIGILWLYFILLLNESLQEKTRQYRAAALSVHRLQAQLMQPEWQERAVAARTMAVQMEGRLWQAPTPGLAQAALQDWLNAASKKAGVSHAQILVTIAEESPTAPTRPDTQGAPPDLWRINAKVNFDFTPGSLLAFLNEIEGHDKQVDIGMLNVRRQPVPRVEVELYAHFQGLSAPAANQEKELVPF